MSNEPSNTNTNKDATRTLDSAPPPPMRNHNGSVMLDDRGEVVYRSQYLSTHPLRKDCMERLLVSPAATRRSNTKLTYVTGDGVIRTMNAAFGNCGWSTRITRERQVLDQVNRQGLHVVGYLVTVRVSLESGMSHEDCGTGECTHESKMKAIDIAFKAAVTDAMKRAARHFGERLGNALYVKGNGLAVAPKDNKTALKMLELSEASDLFGDQKTLHAARAAIAAQNSVSNSQTSVETAPIVNSTVGQEPKSASQASPDLTRRNYATPMDASNRSRAPPSAQGYSKVPANHAVEALVTPHTSFPTPYNTGTPTTDAQQVHQPAGTPPGLPATQTFEQSQPLVHGSPLSSVTPSGSVHMRRPISSDGTRPTPLEDATNRSPPTMNRSDAAGPNPAKRAKMTRNPYERH